ncbi:MAG: glycoside hydrolase family 30 beta sandwich domain-containing protein [Myxococcales bacterium]
MVRIDTSVTHQSVEGFGATTISLAFNDVDNVPAPLRAKAIEALYNQVHLNMGNLEVGPFESSPTALYSPANDDGDPKTLNLAGFNWTQSDNMMTKVVTPGRPFGFDNFWVGPAISETFEFAWAKTLRSSNYDRYLDECAEHVAALAMHWRDAYGITPRLLQLWNEPLSGNVELSGGSTAELTDIVKRAGARLRAEGFTTMKFVIPAEETEDLSLEHATAVLADPVARPFVGAIAYHPYPYGSTYASVPNILATSGAGNPVASRITVRNALRDLGIKYGIPVMMVEVSHSDVAFGTFDGMRGRAIQIHDEMVYADAAAFFGMNAMWDSVSQTQHYAGRADPGLFSETDSIILIDDAAGKIFITEMGRAIGQYARWVPRGSVRVEATTNDPLVQVTAFRDGSSGRVVLVAINNATAARMVRVDVTGVALSTTVLVAGEQSTSAAYWSSITGVAATATGYTVTLPPISVTTYAAKIGAAGPDAGTPDAAGADASKVDVAAGDTGESDAVRFDATPKVDTSSAGGSSGDAGGASGAPGGAAGATGGTAGSGSTTDGGPSRNDGQADRSATKSGGAGCGCTMHGETLNDTRLVVLSLALAITLGLRSRGRIGKAPRSPGTRIASRDGAERHDSTPIEHG